MNQNTDAYNNTAMTNKLIKCIDFVRNINTNKDIINNMNEACVAVINAGVVPGVKTDSHNSTKNDMFLEVRSQVYGMLGLLKISIVKRWMIIMLFFSLLVT